MHIHTIIESYIYIFMHTHMHPHTLDHSHAQMCAHAPTPKMQKCVYISPTISKRTHGTNLLKTELLNQYAYLTTYVLICLCHHVLLIFKMSYTPNDFLSGSPKLVHNYKVFSCELGVFVQLLHTHIQCIFCNGVCRLVAILYTLVLTF